MYDPVHVPVRTGVFTAAELVDRCETAAAKAVPAATTPTATPAAMAPLTGLTCLGLRWRRSRIRCTALLPCAAAGPPEGHSAASSSAAAASPDRPRSSQSGPYAPPATARNSATSAVPSAGRSPGSLASPAATSGRSGSGTGSSGTGWDRCWYSSRSAVSPVNGGRPVRHS